VAHAIHAKACAGFRPSSGKLCRIPEDLIESECSDITRDSFSGAATDKEGKFQKANEGTLFLDEVGT